MSDPAPQPVSEPRTGADGRRGAVVRIAIAVAIALAVSVGVYLLLEATRPASGLVSFSFLLILPAGVSAFVTYVGDPWGERGHRFYVLVPLCIAAVTMIAAILFLREGAVCVAVLSPLWTGSGIAGAWVVRRFRKRRARYNDVFSSALLLAPLAAILIEPSLPIPETTATVTRSVVVEASPAQIWPLLRGIPDIRPGEGRWNLTQDVIGVPRPLGARLIGDGIGADRFARWQSAISFRERITVWEPGRRIGWRFIFEDISNWDFTDRHLRPDSAYFRVEDGGYRLDPLSPTATRVTLETRYWMRTPVNAYAALWGELFLGDLETNLLGLVKDRAERQPPVSHGD